MDTNTATSIYTPEFQEIQTLFQSLERPFCAGDIAWFILTYKRLYPRLSRQERCCAEEFIDLLIAGLERQALAPKMDAVV